MKSGALTRLLTWLLVTMTLLSSGIGCRITSSDIDRWAHTKQGPKKLVAVLTHERYELDLRVEAAITLVEMKPRNGKRVGIVGDEGDDESPGLIAALADLEPAERNKIVSRMVPRIIEGMTKPVPSAEPGKPIVDPSFPYKDTAFALLTYEQEQLVASEKDRQSLEQALASWCVTDFERRVDDASQLYGVEQVLKYLKADGVRSMPNLLHADSSKIDLMARLIADLGDAKTKLAASEKLVGIAKYVSSEKWIQDKAPSVQAANAASKLNPTKEQFAAQLEQYQEESLLKVFGSMKKVGGAPIVDYLLGFAQTADYGEKKRAAALAALEGNIVKCNADDCDGRTRENIEKVMSIARSDDAPDAVRDQALRRVGEMPRKLVVDKLYDLFKHENWKIRWMAADLVLTMSKDVDLDEFMKKLDADAPKLAISEPLQYGFRLAEIKGKTNPAELADRFAKSEYSAGVRTTALSYYFHHGKAKELANVMKYAEDKAAVPPAPDCGEESMGCAWECELPKGEDGKETEVKEVKTVGDFVAYCVKPAMEKRTDDPKKHGGDKEPAGP